MQDAAFSHARCLRQINRYTWSSIRREGDSLQTAAGGCCCDSELYRYNWTVMETFRPCNAQKMQKTHKPHLRLHRPHSACETLTFMTVQLEKVHYSLFREHFFSAERTRAARLSFAALQTGEHRDTLHQNSHGGDWQSHTESHHFYFLKLNMLLQSAESLLLVFYC